VLDQFKEIVTCDFEFGSDEGDRPRPVCLVAHELRSGRKHRLWRDQFGLLPPFPTGPDTLFVAYYASAEIGCFLALGWPAPAFVLDLYAEFRCWTNGKPTLSTWSLAGAMIHFGLDALDVQEKKEMRELAIELGRTGRAATPEERRALLEYCEGDVNALNRLLPVIAEYLKPEHTLWRALLRGRYSGATAARIEWHGVPIDTLTLGRLRRHWSAIENQLVAEVDAQYEGVYDGGRDIKQSVFERYLARRNMSWPRHDSGALDLRGDTIEDMVDRYPFLRLLHETNYTLKRLRLKDIAVGGDGRKGVMLSAFKSRTARNQPSNAKFIFGPARWIRFLIKPPPGYGVAYIDWEQQEFGIAAVLSGDPEMLEAYQSGDPYLAFAKLAGAIPPDGTKSSHKQIRELYKSAVLGISYGMGEQGLHAKLGGPPLLARRILSEHKQCFRKFWRWSDENKDIAILTGHMDTVFGWHLQVPTDYNWRSLVNWPMQSHGSELLRLACCLATERGIEVVAPVHDAILICAPLDRLDADIATTRALMAQASRDVLSGFELRSEKDKVVCWPDRFTDGRGQEMWDKVMRLLDAAEPVREAAE
jgi:hypothetical protein